MTILSGYRIMWMIVMFDLPVMTKKQRKKATKFRQFLLDQGFQMSQYSVYMRFCSGKEQVERRTKLIGAQTPEQGSVHILAITDKQYENITSFYGTRKEPKWKNPNQFTLF